MEVDSPTESHLQASDRLLSSDCSDHFVAGDLQVVATPLSAQTSISTVPATPDADTPPSFLPVKFESSKFTVPSFRQSHAQHAKSMAVKGTPFVATHHSARRPVLPGTVSRVVPGTPLRNAYLALTPGIPSSDRNFGGLRKRSADVLDSFDDGDDDRRAEFEHQEALLFLEIARARSDVRKLEQKLSQARLDEVDTTGRLYKLQAEEADRRMDAAEERVGFIRNSIRSSGGSVCDMSIPKRRRISGDSIRISVGVPSGSPEV